MSDASVVVVGAGVGGLAAAIDLATAGHAVTVVERAAGPGGKIREVAVGGSHVDAGPTVLTMRWVFEELFAAAGARLDERVGLVPAEVLARHAWGGAARLDLYADPRRAEEAIGDFAGAAEARGFRAFRRRAKDIYETLDASFIRAPRPTMLGLVARAGGVGRVLRIRPFETMWGALGEFFRDPRLKQLFGRYATYCGSSPFLAPATLMLVAHVELEGVWFVAGGMRRLPEAMARLAAERGVRFRYGEAVVDVPVERGRVAGVTLGSGERVPARAVVLNADVSALAAGLLGEAPRRCAGAPSEAARSLSALTLCLETEAAGFPLLRHNVFFSGDSEAEFEDLTTRRRLPMDPTVYLCAQDRQQGIAPAPGEAERLLCIINAPPQGALARVSPADIPACVERARAVLRRCGLSIAPEASRSAITGPAEFDRLFPGTGGALYGRATHGATATFQRPGSRTAIPGLYLAGGSVHPGPGVPMATLSGRLAAASLIEDVARSGAGARRIARRAVAVG